MGIEGLDMNSSMHPTIGIGPMHLQPTHLFYNLNVARVYGFHLQGFKGEAVALYRDPLVTKQMEAIDMCNIYV